MCGRFTLPLSPEQIARLLELNRALDAELQDLAGRWNVAPGQLVPVAVQPSPDAPRTARAMRWGLVPSWARDPSLGDRLVNARSETVQEKPAFRDSFRRRRCLVPAGGFYEWGRTGGRKRPWLFTPREGPGLVMAGLWERWSTPQGEPLETFTILTTGANELVGRVHGRMPVILPREAFTDWLTAPPPRAGELRRWLRPLPAAEMTARPVSTWVNDPRHEGPRCAAPPSDDRAALF